MIGTQKIGRYSSRRPPFIWLRAFTLGAVVLTGCQALPPLDTRTPSHALDIETARQTTLGRASAPAAAAHPGESGVFMLADSRQAFATRALLAAAAEQTLDVQYYIWRNDITGTLLLKALLEAAERGVRVRLLLDDMNTSDLDPLLAALDTHENIEVRLFNPFAHRRLRFIDFITLEIAISKLKHQIEQLRTQILSIKENETYQEIQQIEDWDDYFSDLKNQLLFELENLRNEVIIE